MKSNGDPNEPLPMLSPCDTSEMGPVGKEAVRLYNG